MDPLPERAFSFGFAAGDFSQSGFIKTKLRMGAIALLLGLMVAGARSQPAQPTVNVQTTAGNSNLLFQLTTQPGWFYTFLQTTTLTNWGYATDYFAGGTALSWTNPLAATDAQRFFQVLVSAPNTTVISNYHSWTNVVSVNNGIVEALVSPTDGRIQQFRFLGDTNGVLWENSSLFGHTPNPGLGYNNFGGDKAWPSPQTSFSGLWPPPTGFDGTTNSASFTNGIVTLVTPVDATFKIQTTKIVELLFNEPVMRVRTIFQRISAPTATNNTLSEPLGVWLDCQSVFTNTSRCYVPIASPSIFSNGYTTNGSPEFTAALPPTFTNTNGIISFSMPPTGDQKLGFDGGTVVIVGTNLDLRADAPRVAGATYPDGNSSTEVYTDQGYFEVELLGPMSTLPVGGQMEFDTYYTIFRRTEATSDAEAQKVLSWHY